MRTGEDADMSQFEEQLKGMLLNSRNIILSGAPGTGKTHLAKQIAYAITGDDEDTSEEERHWAFVQFHPSYDYTDFVEGLRPVPSVGNDNIGFKRNDGVFKAFCKRASQRPVSNEQEYFRRVFNGAFDKLINRLNETLYMEVPYLTGNGRIRNNSGSNSFRIEPYPNGKGVYAIPTDRSIIHMNLDQLYRVYRDLPGVPAGGNDNYRKAVVKLLKDQFGLIEYENDTLFQNNDDMMLQKYVFIIDEINRGDIARIFGELFFSIDPDYRGKAGKIQTQYSNLIEDDDLFKDGFYVPENVYIIGTMNDIDRNVECMDFAIRRRFTWVEIKPEDTVTMLNDPEKGIPEYKGKAQKCMDAINKAIKEMPGLGSAYQLGAAYFLKLKNYGGDFELLWKNHIGPLLKEYLRGMPDAEATVNSMKQKWDSALRAEAAETAEIPAAAQPETELQPESAENQPATEQQ